ncbi:DUF3035 domain-containing protein [Temperatibacter marinus]|uniref:DUF3035 domain-containing protein n=1 Tax=Temperatibacter marinus TaxID=1456591 RepID=A0AA52EBD9_9PROT|nr:DUF3035 domain-containing protein [Temperatibacter marinus]WND01620.1 DUF3035 domain-containing protein [Temperatibacter marinus]
MKKLVMITIVALSLTACSSGSRNAPDEFQVVSNSALVVPPGMTLAPPKPGKTESRAIAPAVIAKEVLFPKKKDTVKDPDQPKGAELDLLRKLNRLGFADVRSNVGRPDVFVTKKKLLIAEILEMPDGSYAPDNIVVKRN